MNSLTLLGGLDLGESSKESFAELKPPVYSLGLIFQNFKGKKKSHDFVYKFRCLCKVSEIMYN